MKNNNMATGVFRLKGRQLYGKGISEGRVRNIQEIADRSGMSYPTAHRWVDKSEEITGADYETLAGFLIDGLGLTPDEVSKLDFGEIFEFVPTPDNGSSK